MDWPPWVLVLITGAASQLLKFALYGVANRQASLRPLVTTNGLPSLYAVAFGCLAATIWVEHGTKAPIFVVVFIFTGIILHDAIRLQGSMDSGGRAALLVAERIETDGRQRLIQQLRPLLGDRRHRPLHVIVGLLLGILAGLAWSTAGV